jgi:hypothetical protein
MNAILCTVLADPMSRAAHDSSEVLIVADLVTRDLLARCQVVQNGFEAIDLSVKALDISIKALDFRLMECRNLVERVKLIRSERARIAAELATICQGRPSEENPPIGGIT